LTATPFLTTGPAAVEYTRDGFSLCAIPLGRKGPTAKGWNLFENAITSPATATALTGNVGLLHAWSRTMALDVDDWGAASQYLLARGVNLAQLFSAPDRVEIVSGRAGRAKLLFRLPTSLDECPQTLQIENAAKEMILEFRCADKGGNSMQDVLPPSIHPDTGKPYQWGGPGDWRKLPVIPEVLLQIWQDELTKRTKGSAPAAPLTLPLGFAPQGFSPQPGFAPLEENLWGMTVMESVLDHISPNTDYPTWRNIGWAIMSTGWKCAPQIVHGWSKLASLRYNPITTDDLIRGFDPSKGITIATLFHHAKQNGWIMPQQYPPALAPLAPPPPAHLPLLMTADQIRQLPAMPYIVRSVFPAQGLAAIYGEPGAGKSFLALHLAHAIAIGTADWFGFRVRQRPVIYVALEGVGGIGKRTTAMELHSKQLCPDQLRFWCRDIHLLTGDGIDLLASEIVAAVGKGAVVIVDTLNQASPGADENTSHDMGKIIANSKRLAGAVGGLAILVHHAGKNRAQGLRGHSSLHAAMDVVLEIATVEGKHKTWSITKAKDDSSEAKRDFDLIPYTVGQDEFGDPITSCAVQHTIHAAPLKLKLPTGKHQKAALAELRNQLQQPGRGMDYKAAVALVASVVDAPAIKKGDRAKEAVQALIRDGHLILNELGVCLA